MGKIASFVMLVFVLVGCSSSYEINIYNETEHLLYASINNQSQNVIQANESLTVELDDETSWPFQEIRKNVDLNLEGETFVMFQGDGQTSLTNIEIRPDKPYNIHANPTHASVRLINNSNQIIASFDYRKNYEVISNTYHLNGSIEVGESIFARLPYPTLEDNFTIDFIITVDDVEYFYNGENGDGYTLGLDEQLVIEFQ